MHIWACLRLNLDIGHFTLNDTAGQSWPNYKGPKREKKTSLSNQFSVYTFSPEGGVVWNVPYWQSLAKKHAECLSDLELEVMSSSLLASLVKCF